MSNKSKTYLLPYMAEFIEIKFVHRLLDTYILHNDVYQFCMKYEFSGKKSFTDYEASLTKNPYFTEMVDISKEEVLYVFDFPDEMYPVIDLFSKGRYSYLPERGRIKRFLIKHFKVDPTHRIFHILDRTEHLRSALEDSLGVKIPKDLDLEDPPNLEEEQIITIMK
jgi:hypothetical protein